MLRTIDVLPNDGDMTFPVSCATGSVSPYVIKRATIARAHQANSILADAQARAAAIIADAEKAAAQIKAAGFRTGLETGLQSALTPIVAMVSEWDKVKAVLREDAENALRVCIEDLVTRDGTLAALVEIICEAHTVSQPDKVHIRVPQGVHVPTLQTRCLELNLDAAIEVAEAPDSVSVSWRGHVWTAQLGEVAKEAWSSCSHGAAAVSDIDAAVICRDALLDVANTLAGDDP